MKNVSRNSGGRSAQEGRLASACFSPGRRSVLALAIGWMSPQAEAVAPTEVWVQVQTDLGAFVIAVHPAIAPLTVANFLAYVDAGALDQASVYRIVTLGNQPEGAPKIQVVQWGLNSSPSRPLRRPPILHESTLETGLRHRDGTVSMARLGVGTASSDFFICLGAQPELDHGGRRQPDGQGFAAFGQVVQGMEVVRALHARGGTQAFLPAPLPIRRVNRVPVSSRRQ